MFEKFLSLVLRPRFPEWSIPLAFLAALLLAFGLLIPKLGIYQDDWLFHYNYYALGPQGIWEFMYYDGTPFASILNNAQYALLGFAPINWHITSLLSRWLTVVTFWMVLRRLWPGQPRQVFWASLVFALHPFFTLQPMAVTFSQVWVTYFALGLSFYWMILSVQQPARYWIYTILSILAGAFTLLSGEYFAGLEFARPIILWFALVERYPNPYERFKHSLRYWIPYLLALSVYIYWRFFVYEVPIANRNQPTLVRDLLSNPVSGVLQIVTNLIPDTMLIVLSSWYKLLEPDWLDFTVRINQFALLLALGAGFAAFYYLTQQTYKTTDTRATINWPRQALFLGLVLLVFGLIPPYVGGLFLNAKNPLWNSRFGLASMLGASLIVIAFLEILVVSKQARIIFLAAFVGLSAGWHLRYTNDFRWAWERQTNFYRQLSVRIPELEAGTALVSENEILSLMGDYPTAYAINTIYARQGNEEEGRLRYWFYGLTTNFSREYESFVQGMTLFSNHRSMVFRGHSHEVLLFTFEHGSGQCLHILRPEDFSSRTVPQRLRGISAISQVDRIGTSDSFNPFMMESLGIQPVENWCYYYQRADLARQQQDWPEVIRLWKTIRQAGLKPNDNYEYLPFLEAFLYTGQPDQAIELSALATKHPPSMRRTVCDIWTRILADIPAGEEMLSAHQQIQLQLACSQ